MKTNFFPQVGLSIKPEEWVYVGYYFIMSVADGHGGRDYECESEVIIPEGAEFTESELMGEFHSTERIERCGCCNHRIKRGSFFYNKPTDAVIFVGFDCAKNIMKYRFNVGGVKKQTLAQRKLKIKMDAIQKAFSEYAGLEAALLDGEYNKIIRDIRERLFKWGNISPAQVGLVMKIAAQRAEYVQVAKPLPVGKFEGELEVVSTKIVRIDEPSRYSPRGVLTHYNQSTLLKHPTDGWKIWVKNFGGKAASESEFVAKAGDRVIFKANIEGSEKDPYFGFAKRVNWKFLEQMANQSI